MESNKKMRNPIAWVPSAYFAMGLPFVIVNMVAVLMYKDLGVDEKTITFWTGLLLLPWSLKFLWSPLMELYRTKKFYVVLTQLLTGASFGLIALALQLPSFWAVTVALFAVVALSGSTHDVALDGLYMQELDKKTQVLVCRQQFKLLRFCPDSGLFKQLPGYGFPAGLPCFHGTAGIFPGAGKALTLCPAGQKHMTLAVVDPNTGHKAIFPIFPMGAAAMHFARQVPVFVIDIIPFHRTPPPLLIYTVSIAQSKPKGNCFGDGFQNFISI